MAQPKLTAKPTEGLQDTAISLDIEVEAGDPHDTLVIRVGPLPECSALTAGRADAARVWSLTPGELGGLRFVPPLGLFGSVALAVEVEAHDAAGQTNVTSGTLKIVVTALSDAALRDRLKEAFVPAARWQRWLTGVLLILGSALIVSLWFLFIEKAQDIAAKEYSFAWEQPAGTVLASDGPSFWYDRASKTLHHRGAIDAERKHELLSLLSLQVQAPASVPAGSTPPLSDTEGDEGQLTDGGDEAEPTAGAPGTAETRLSGQPADDERLLDFRAAIDALAYQSLADAGLHFMVLLTVAGLSGAVGVQVRATINFVRIACFNNILDVRRWWPWYLLRPLLGFILGVLIVLLVQSEIFTPDGASTPEGTTWWLAAAFLVGFGAEDFSERLRLLSQTLFGKGS